MIWLLDGTSLAICWLWYTQGNPRLFIRKQLQNRITLKLIWSNRPTSYLLFESPETTLETDLIILIIQLCTFRHCDPGGIVYTVIFVKRKVFSLNPHLIRDAIKFQSFLMLASGCFSQVLPLLWVFLRCPLLDLILPVLIRDCIIEQSNTTKVSMCMI